MKLYLSLDYTLFNLPYDKLMNRH